MDIKTPRNVHLSGFYKRSFAFKTVKNRMPIIVTNLIDNLVRRKKNIFEEYGEEVIDELKKVIGDLSELKYEIQTNKPLKPLTSKASDAQMYNEYIATETSEEGPPTHFHTIWLLTECYMYRRIRQMFEETKLLHNFDPFRDQKEEAYFTALPVIAQMGEYLLTLINDIEDPTEKEFINLLKLNLWGNKCDLSISLGQIREHSKLFDVSALDPHILSDYSKDIWKAICANSTSDIIDIIFDNSGYEVFTDLCLADFIISKNIAKHIRLYVKMIPWFISDVMTHDLYWTLEQMKTSDNEILSKLGGRWKGYLDNGTWSVVETNFWTLPYSYTHMKRVQPNLYKKLAEAKLAIFKGDLNYRKLFDERNWDPATPIDVALQDFHPTKLCILRTIKADVVAGLEQGLAERVETQDPIWMETGTWGLIQYSGLINKID